MRSPLPPLVRGAIWSLVLLLAVVLKVAVPQAVAVSQGQTAVLYKLPWSGGASYPVIQDYNKHFDFRLPGGTLVRAARGGTVYVKRASADGGCCDPSCSVYDNYVRILHEDGTYGFYQHLQYGGITVNTGDVVQTGDCLGLSGATGYICGLTGAHLHFNVNTNIFNSGGDPYGSAFTEVQFVEGAIPTGGAYTPPSQNSITPCSPAPSPTATPTATATPTSQPNHRKLVYLPLTMRSGD